MTTGFRTKTWPTAVQDEDWILEFADFAAAWELTPPRPEGKQKGEGLIVVQADTGYTNHPEIAGGRYSIERGRNFFPDPNIFPGRPHLRLAIDTLKPEGFPSHPSHGTSTASVLMSGEGPPESSIFPHYAAPKAIWGVAPGTKLIPFRVCRTVLLNDESGLALGRALFYIAEKMDTAEIAAVSVSLGRLSLGGIEGKSQIIAALKAVRKKGVITCAAAGQAPEKWCSFNSRGSATIFSPGFPARDPNAICVAGCIANLEYSALSNGAFGPEVDITAPGEDIWIAKAKRADVSPIPIYGVELSWGTSYSTAIVAGACALWQAYHGRSWLLDPSNYGPELIFPLFKEVLKRSAFKPPGWDVANRGAGVLDAKQLLLEPLPSKDELQGD